MFALFFIAAETHHLTGENYVWVVTQSVIEGLQPPSSFPVCFLTLMKEICYFR